MLVAFHREISPGRLAQEIGLQVWIPQSATFRSFTLLSALNMSLN